MTQPTVVFSDFVIPLPLLCPFTGENEPLLKNVPIDAASVAIMDYSTMTQPSLTVSVIAKCGKAESISSQWKFGSGCSLKLPRSLPEASYILEVCMPDGNCVKIPLELPVCMPNEVQATVDLS